jgi:glycosyltransferase involved in cell wall biosynthesis
VRTTEIAAELASRLGWQWCSTDVVYRACRWIAGQSEDPQAPHEVRLDVNTMTGEAQPVFRGRRVQDSCGLHNVEIEPSGTDPRIWEIAADEIRRFAAQGHSVIVGSRASIDFPSAVLQLCPSSPQTVNKQPIPIRSGMALFSSAGHPEVVASRLKDRVKIALGSISQSVSVIIPTRSRQEDLRLVLPRLQAAAENSTADVQIIVVDDGSTDDTATIAADLGAQVVMLKASRGVSGARNAGLQVAVGRIVIFLDSDMLVGQDFIEEHVRLHEVSDETVVVGGRRHLPPGVRTSDNPSLLRWDSRAAILDLYSYNMACLSSPWSIAYGCNISVERCLIDRAAPDGFDTSFVGWGLEDQEFAYRLHKGGARWAYSRASTAAHLHHDRTITPERYAGWMSNLQYFVEKHPECASLYELASYMDPARNAEPIDCYRRFDGGRTVSEVERLAVLRVSETHDPLVAVQAAVSDGATEVAIVDDEGRPELAVMAAATAPGASVRLYSEVDWARLELES